MNYRPLEFTTLVEKLDSNFDWDCVLIGFTGGIEPNNGANFLRSSGNLHIWNPDREKARHAVGGRDRSAARAGHRGDGHAEARALLLADPGDPARPVADHRDGAPASLTSRTRTRCENYDPTVWGVYKPECIQFAAQLKLTADAEPAFAASMAQVSPQTPAQHDSADHRNHLPVVPGDVAGAGQLSLQPEAESVDLAAADPADGGASSASISRCWCVTCKWLWAVLHLNLGISLAYRVSVTSLIGSRALNTIILSAGEHAVLVGDRDSDRNRGRGQAELDLGSRAVVPGLFRDVGAELLSRLSGDVLRAAHRMVPGRRHFLGRLREPRSVEQNRRPHQSSDPAGVRARQWRGWRR